MESGRLVVGRVGGKSTVTRCFSKYPLKFIVPTKAGPSSIDTVWIYTLTYGGGIVSGDCISFDLTVEDACTAVLTTQASTKVYKSVASKCSEQVMEARIGNGALLVVIPDPVTCFSTAKYAQNQVFRMTLGSSLLIVDWITSGRHESGEKWDFTLYKSTNHIYMETKPLFLDTVLLENRNATSIAERMQDYQA
ncbi:urease accessory protein D-like isoform X1 [Bidens hawaiensis]|uniref:urease accessory protein D-like isoform X1 n=1 Tax=Bidens hawaiensis TaxID=980011 RepID=UPI00404B922A